MANEGRLVRLKQIYDEIETLNPEILSDLNKVIRLYSQAQMLIGYLDADALYRYGAVYAERKRVHAEVIQASRGTVAEKESLAEIETYELRLREVEAKAESRKWQNLFKATENLIIAYRRDERTALEEYKKVNDIYGR
ncbi:hypothetical protein [Virgibacillus pantothenticus]|uniref:Flagellar FliJ protein n=2 Tax=Virgibacillus pantothenticus TaxID=1473 RepID=A0A0L0QKN8_VIRPA|nr:hypothetical protein [Virgibacillus pantothenticus]KNE19069.1 hypothetical protein AFK71_10945 [Virgibacillus pantothenticus]QTY15518.1 hypothetical protein KBP50_16745 [Virgibacillus pantothenticus]